MPQFGGAGTSQPDQPTPDLGDRLSAGFQSWAHTPLGNPFAGIANGIAGFNSGQSRQPTNAAGFAAAKRYVTTTSCFGRCAAESFRRPPGVANACLSAASCRARTAPTLAGVSDMADEVGPELAGAAFDLANAGYAPMPDPGKKPEEQEIGGDSASLRDAAERLSTESDPVVVRGYLDESGEPAPQNEAITLARAARDYADVVAAERLVAENESSKSLAERIRCAARRGGSERPRCG